MDANTPEAGRLQPSGPACAALASQVALLGTGMLAEEEEADVRAHMATCDYCSAAERTDALLGGVLRRSYGASAENTFSSGAWFTREDILDLVHDGASALPTKRATAPARFPRPAVHTRGDGRGHGWRTAIAPLVAVLVIALGAALLFSRGGRRGVGPIQPALTAGQLQALAGDTVLLSTQDGVYALRASDGTVRWEYSPVPGNQIPTPSGAIAVAGNVVYAISGIPNLSNPAYPTKALVALQLSDGHLLWSRSLAFADYGEAMTLADGVLYLSPSTVNEGGGYTDIEHLTMPIQAGDHTAYAVRASDGKVLWATSTQEPMIAIPYVANGLVYLGTTDSIEAVRASDGSVKWSQPMGAGGGTPQGTLTTYVNGISFAVRDSQLIVDLEVVRIQSETANGWQGTTTNQITALDAATGARAGFSCSGPADEAPAVSSPVVIGDGALYQEGAGIWALSLDDLGSCHIRWFANLDTFQAGFTYADGVIYSTDAGQSPLPTDPASSGNYTHAVRASDGRELWRSPTNGGLDAQAPTTSGGLVFASAGGGIYALDASNGAKVWRFLEPRGALVSAPPVFVAGA